MVVLRIILILCVTLAASLSAAAEAGHAVAVERSHISDQMMDAGSADAPVCCEDSAEPGQACQALPVFLGEIGAGFSSPATRKTGISIAQIRLIGVTPAGSVDPPRWG